jgi:hypothetical protein
MLVGLQPKDILLKESSYCDVCDEVAGAWSCTRGPATTARVALEQR